jgi:hypothetical protein
LIDEKTEGRKSRATVPLTNKSEINTNLKPVRRPDLFQYCFQPGR